jgi:hypothetical protein
LAQTASYISASNLPNNISFATQSLFATQSIYASQSINAYSASWVSASAFITTAQTASYISASNLPPHTSSWSNTALSSLFATQSIYASQSINAYSASWVSASAFITTAQTASYISASNLPPSITSSFSGSFFGPAPSFAWGAFSVIGSTVTNNMPYNTTITRLGLGTYICAFSHPTTRTGYAIAISAASASTNANYVIGPTASVCATYGLTNNGFTMSFCLASTPTTKNDPMSGSVIVNSY